MSRRFLTYHGFFLENERQTPERMGEFMTQKNESDHVSLDERLRTMEKAGVRLYLDGLQVSSEKIALNCVREEALYMPDYVTDDEGRLKEIRYDKISLK